MCAKTTGLMFEGRRVTPVIGLFAPTFFSVRTGEWRVDHTAVRYRAKDAREEFARHWPGGWPDALKKGWRIRRVDIYGHNEETNRA